MKFGALGSGQLWWGDHSGVADTYLGRTEAGVLLLENTLSLQGITPTLRFDETDTTDQNAYFRLNSGLLIAGKANDDFSVFSTVFQFAVNDTSPYINILGYTDDARIIIDSGRDDAGVEESFIIFRDAGNNKFLLKKDSSNDFTLHDSVNVKNRLVVLSTGDMQFQPGGGGNVTIGSGSSPSGTVHIDQDEAAGGLPCLVLEQTDVSEEFTRYVGSAATGTLTRSLVDDDDVTTPTLVGWTKVYVQDDGNQITDGAYYVPFYSLA